MSSFVFEIINYSDVCQIVERIKEINITAALNLKLEPHLITWANFHHPDETIPPYIAAIREQGANAEDEQLKSLASILADELERVYSAIQSGLNMPSVEYVLHQYADGEIGDRTAMRILNCSVHELHELLRGADLPTIHDEPSVH